MNLILIKPSELDHATVTLTDRRADHIRSVLRGSVGDTVRVGILDGPMGTGVIQAISAESVVLGVDAADPPPPPPATDLILALPRPIILKKVLAQAASLGVGRIFLVNANRVEKSFFNASIIKDNAYRSYLELGLEQAVDTRMPQVSIHTRFRPFVEDLLPGAAARCPIKLIAHPESDRFLFEQVPAPLSSRVLLAIGPEGGWVEYEIDKFRQQGFLPFSLGPRILRLDTAVPALLAQIDLLRLTGRRQAPGP